ncbi:MAG: (Fe-S)-binding protein [Promethearchaeota archaeon]|nr:MAG: (Fe-S)-binding protein [Candidatus Lokiarchaeota archaeon]
MTELKQEKKEMTPLKREDKFKHLSKVEKEIMTCISCGDCREATDYTMNPPRWGVCVAQEHTSGFEPFFGRGKMQIARSIWQGKLDMSHDLAEVFYQCPTCNACSEICSYDLNNTNVYEALRAELVEAGFGLESHEPMNKAMIELLNPYQRDNKQKNDWIEKLDIEVKDAYEEEAEVLYFVGCTAALTPELQSVAIDTAKVLTKLGVDFSVFGKHEVCCGSVAMRTGDRKAFNEVASKNIELFKKCGAKTIITSCAGCYRTLKLDYANYLKDLDIEVLHTIEFLIRLMDEKDIQLKDLGLSVTYHDPCHTGRHMGENALYEEPRSILEKMANNTEMNTIKQNAKCCGAGGGLKKGFADLALEIAKSRVKEAEETGADYLVSICPFCYRNLSDAIKDSNSHLEMIDLLELINKALENPNQ